jgi:hypothetical protein
MAHSIAQLPGASVDRRVLALLILAQITHVLGDAGAFPRVHLAKETTTMPNTVEAQPALTPDPAFATPAADEAIERTAEALRARGHDVLPGRTSVALSHDAIGF